MLSVKSNQSTSGFAPRLCPVAVCMLADRTASASEHVGTQPLTILSKTQQDPSAIQERDRLAKVLAHLMTPCIASAMFVSPVHKWDTSTDGSASFNSDWACHKCGISSFSADDVPQLVQHLNLPWHTTPRTVAGQKVRGAPLWLRQRMAALRQMPPPTLNKVRAQLKASAELRRKLDDRLTASSSGR